MNAWLIIGIISVATYGLRVSMFLVLGRWSLPTWTATPMALVGPAAIAALTVPMLLTRHGSFDVMPASELTAVVAGFLAVRRSGNVMHAFAAGMPVYWLLSALV